MNRRKHHPAIQACRSADAAKRALCAVAFIGVLALMLLPLVPRAGRAIAPASAGTAGHKPPATSGVTTQTALAGTPAEVRRAILTCPLCGREFTEPLHIEEVTEFPKLKEE